MKENKIKLTPAEAVTYRDIYENVAIRLNRTKEEKMQKKLKKQIELLKKLLDHLVREDA